MPDVLLTSDGDIAIIAGDMGLTLDETGETTAQRVAIRLRWHYGEWFLDKRKGVRYRERVFVKAPDLLAIESMLKATIIGTKGITSLLTYQQTFHAATRLLSVTYSATCDNGAIITKTEAIAP